MKLAWDGARHKSPKTNYDRPRSDQLYHSTRWTKLSKKWREQHPLCEECKRHGIIAPAECVDHIVPFPICQDFFDESNLQSLCAHCNMEKGNRDMKRIQDWKSKHYKDALKRER